MYPYIVIFNRTVGLYGVMSCIGALAAGGLLCFLIRKKGGSIDDTILFLLFVCLGVILGGHLLYGITGIGRVKELLPVKSLSELTNLLKDLFGGAVFYGGLIGGSLCGLLAIRLWRLNPAIYADGMAMAAPLFHFFGRIGCFLGGCCYGIESRFGWIAHNPLLPEMSGVSRFPVQLLEAALNLMILGLILVLYTRKKLRGKLFLVYLSVYAVIRFFVEFLRGDQIRGFLFGLSTSQFISILIEAFVLSALLLLRAKRKKA